MKGYYIEITNNLLDPKHCLAMGNSVWLFLWFLDKMTSISESGKGKVLGGMPIKYERIEKELGISDKTYRRWLEYLRVGGYISTVRTPYGVSVSVNKAKKIFGQKNSDRSNVTDQSWTKMTDLSISLDKNDRSNIRQYSIDNTIESNNKIIAKEKNTPQITASVEYLRNPPEGYITKLSTEYSIPEPFILEEKDKCLNYLAYKGRRYKDYNLFFRNWVRNSWAKVPDWKKDTMVDKKEDGLVFEEHRYVYRENGKVLKESESEEEMSVFLKTKGINFVPNKKAKPGEYVFKAPTTEQIQEDIKNGKREIWNF